MPDPTCGRKLGIMRTIDTNVLSALWSKSRSSRHSKNLGNGKDEEVYCGAPVYAELLAYPKLRILRNGFLADTGIDVDFEFQQSLWLEGRRFALCKRRRRLHTTVRALLADSSLDRMP